MLDGGRKSLTSTTRKRAESRLSVARAPRPDSASGTSWSSQPRPGSSTAWGLSTSPYTVAMYYGHGSWIALVVFGALFVMRILSQHRRRRGYGGAPASRSSTSTGFQDPAAGSTSPTQGTHGRGGTRFTSVAPGWFADPFAKHEQRYWSGTQWTEHVADAGVPATDPPPSAR